MTEVLRTATLMLVLINPFLMVVYLADVIQRLGPGQFRDVMIRAGLISGGVFCFFAVLGDVVFSKILQTEFASFQIFGGIVFLLIGVQFVFRGPTAIEILRGESEHLAGAIAMPVFIGPGTISASVVAGERHEPLVACVTLLAAVVISVSIILFLKRAHDSVRQRSARLIERYIEIAGRIAALYVGTVAVEMIMQGLGTWIEKF